MEDSTKRDLLEMLREDRMNTALSGDTQEIRSINFKEAMDAQSKYLDMTKEWNHYDEIQAKTELDRESLDFQKQKFETEMEAKKRDRELEDKKLELEIRKLELAEKNSDMEYVRIANEKARSEAELKSRRRDRFVNILVPVVGGIMTIGGIVINRIFQRSNMKLNIQMEESGHWDSTSAEREATKEACSFK